MGMRMHGGAGGGCVVCTPKSRHGIRNGHGIAMKTRATSPALRSRGCHPPSEHSGRPWSSTHAFSTSRIARMRATTSRYEDARALLARLQTFWAPHSSPRCTHMNANSVRWPVCAPISAARGGAGRQV